MFRYEKKILKTHVHTRLRKLPDCTQIDCGEFGMLWLPWATHRKVWHKMAVWTATSDLQLSWFLRHWSAIYIRVVGSAFRQSKCTRQTGDVDRTILVAIETRSTVQGVHPIPVFREEAKCLWTPYTHLFFQRFNQLLLIQPTTNAKWSLNRRDNNSSNDTKRCWWYTILLMVRQIRW